MLVLSRKENECILIGYHDAEGRMQTICTVMVVDIRGDKVRLGVEAPPNIMVHRAEVWESIQRTSEPNQGLGGRDAAT